MAITRAYHDALKVSWPGGRTSVASRGEFAPVEAEVDDQQ